MKKSMWIGIAAATLLPAVAWAQQAYLGGGIGQGTSHVPSVTAPAQGFSGQDGTTRDTSWKFYGGYQFDQNWGLELGYNYLGNGFTINANTIPAGATGSASYRVSNWYIAGTGTLPFGNGFGLQGKLGVVRNSVSGGGLCLGGGCGGLNQTGHTDLLVGVGLKYSFNKNWSGLLEYEDYGKTTGNDVWGTGSSGSMKASAWNLSVRYDF